MSEHKLPEDFSRWPDRSHAIGRNASDAARCWATKLLGIAEEASRREARCAYFRLVREKDFVPPRPLQRAVEFVEGKLTSFEPDAEWVVEEEDRLHVEVESFADAFFSHSMEERRQRWDALISQCQGVPPLRVRLHDLKLGLGVDMTSLPLDGSDARALAGQLLKLFPMRLLPRAASRQAYVRRIEESPDGVHRRIEQAARYLVAVWPALVALDEPLVLHLAKLRGGLKQRRWLEERPPTGKCRKCGFGHVLYDAATCPSCGTRNPNPGVVNRMVMRCVPLAVLFLGGAGCIVFWSRAGEPGVGLIIGVVFGVLLGLITAFVLSCVLRLAGRR